MLSLESHVIIIIIIHAVLVVIIILFTGSPTIAAEQNVQESSALNMQDGEFD